MTTSPSPLKIYYELVIGETQRWGLLCGEDTPAARGKYKHDREIRLPERALTRLN